MTWARVWQLSAETRSLADVQQYAGVAGWASLAPFTISSVNKYSGEYSYRMSDSVTAKAGGRVFDGTYQTMRANFMLYHEGTEGVYNVPVPITAVLLSGVPCTFYWDWYNSAIGFLAGWEPGTSNYRYPISGVADTALASTANRWCSLGVAARFAETDGYVIMYIDGVEVMAWRGDTRVYASGSTEPRTGTNGFYALGGGQGYGLLSLQGWKNTYVDDFYIDTGDGSETENPPPLRRFLPSYVSGPGDSTQWSVIGENENWKAVDDSVSDEDTTYVKAGVTGLVDTYTLSPVDIPDDYVVRSIIPIADVLKTNAALQMTTRLLLKKNGETTESEDLNLPVDFGGFIWQRLESDLNGIGWTEADLQAMQVGQKSTGSFE